MFAKMMRRVLFVIRSGFFLENRDLESLKLRYADGVVILFHFAHIKRKAAGRTLPSGISGWSSRTYDQY
jgi:hypothetical protein